MGARQLAYRTILVAVMASCAAGCQQKEKSAENIKREILDADFNAAMKKAGEMRFKDRKFSVVLSSAFQPFIDKHSLQTLRNEIDRRFGLKKSGHTSSENYEIVFVEGLNLKSLSWNFYFRDRLMFSFTYSEDWNSLKGIFIIVHYHPIMEL